MFGVGEVVWGGGGQQSDSPTLKSVPERGEKVLESNREKRVKYRRKNGTGTERLQRQEGEQEDEG